MEKTIKHKTYYRDFYGCSASITRWRDKFVLKVSNGYKIFYKKIYNSFIGARIAMGKLGDGWEETDNVQKNKKV